jgi:hypothetical protein
MGQTRIKRRCRVYPGACQLEKAFEFPMLRLNFLCSLLDRLVQHIKGFGDVWFATHEEVARWCKAKGGT